MVSKSSNQHTSVTIKTGRLLFLALLFIFIAASSYIMCLIFLGDKPDKVEIDGITLGEVEESEEPEPEPTPVLPDKIDFQDIVDNWTSSVGGNKSVLIYDLERDELVGAFNPDESYNTASLYKLFVVYNGYQKLTNGEWNVDDTAGRTGRTILKCLDLAIRESNSECAETLWSMIGRDNLAKQITDNYNITNSNINSLISNPRDILKMMQIYYEHKDVNDEVLLSQMEDSFLVQPTTTYNWRQGLPSGFSRANVYNKVGWEYNPNGKYWNIYHDAAIVEFPKEDRHFIVVVMTNKVPFQKIAELGSKIEDEFFSTY